MSWVGDMEGLGSGFEWLRRSSGGGEPPTRLLMIPLSTLDEPPVRTMNRKPKNSHVKLNGSPGRARTADLVIMSFPFPIQER